MAKPNVHLLFEHDTSGRPHSSAYIRLIQPFQAISTDDNFSISASLELPKNNVDLVVVDRLWKGWGCERDGPSCDRIVCAIVKIKLVHSLDDNLYDRERSPQIWRTLHP